MRHLRPRGAALRDYEGGWAARLDVTYKLPREFGHWFEWMHLQWFGAWLRPWFLSYLGRWFLGLFARWLWGSFRRWLQCLFARLYISITYFLVSFGRCFLGGVLWMVFSGRYFLGWCDRWHLRRFAQIWTIVVWSAICSMILFRKLELLYVCSIYAE